MKFKYFSVLALYLSICMTSMCAQGGLDDILFPPEAGDEIEAPIDDFFPMIILLFVGVVVGVKYIRNYERF